jgi:hypothetical protein
MSRMQTECFLFALEAKFLYRRNLDESQSGYTSVSDSSCDRTPRCRFSGLSYSFHQTLMPFEISKLLLHASHAAVSIEFRQD